MLSFVKETKKFTVYEGEVGNLGRFIFKDPKEFEAGGAYNQASGEVEPFQKMIFQNPLGKKSECRCYQDEPLNDIATDLDLINSGNIKATNYYTNWIKLLFQPGEYYSIIVEGKACDGQFIGEDTFKHNTFNFKVNGEKIKSENIIYIHNSKEYLL